MLITKKLKKKTEEKEEGKTVGHCEWPFDSRQEPDCGGPCKSWNGQ